MNGKGLRGPMVIAFHELRSKLIQSHVPKIHTHTQILLLMCQLCELREEY